MGKYKQKHIYTGILTLLYLAVATGLGNFARVLGGALGIGTYIYYISIKHLYLLFIIAISSTVLNTQLAEKLPQVLPPQIAAAVLSSSEYVHHGLPEEYFATTLHVYTESLRLCWYVLTPMAGLGFFSALLIKNHSMKQHGRNNKKPTENNEESVVVEVPINETEGSAKQEEKSSV